ncbi:hypothetical protein AAHA92_30128 [Salvia divinorum]|uniref:Uncharacterized protein n=1 Tax=Salvia divinorum TaxID=28513 RepID=A0ABD1G393_SALDI
MAVRVCRCSSRCIFRRRCNTYPMAGTGRSVVNFTSSPPPSPPPSTHNHHLRLIPPSCAAHRRLEWPNLREFHSRPTVRSRRLPSADFNKGGAVCGEKSYIHFASRLEDLRFKSTQVE